MKTNLTLSRWHKVAERINAALKVREERTLAALTATTARAGRRASRDRGARRLKGAGSVRAPRADASGSLAEPYAAGETEQTGTLCREPAPVSISGGPLARGTRLLGWAGG